MFNECILYRIGKTRLKIYLKLNRNMYMIGKVVFLYEKPGYSHISIENYKLENQNNPEQYHFFHG